MNQRNKYFLFEPFIHSTYYVQRSAKVGAPGLVNIITAFAYHICNLPQLACRIHSTWCIYFSRSLYTYPPAYVYACYHAYPLHFR